LSCTDTGDTGVIAPTAAAELALLGELIICVVVALLDVFVADDWACGETDAAAIPEPLPLMLLHESMVCSAVPNDEF
jgi:hypothetical protein